MEWGEPTPARWPPPTSANRRVYCRLTNQQVAPQLLHHLSLSLLGATFGGLVESVESPWRHNNVKGSLIKTDWFKCASFHLQRDLPKKMSSCFIHSWLVVDLPLRKIMEFVSWDDYSIPNFSWKVIQNSMVPVTTKQIQPGKASRTCPLSTYSFTRLKSPANLGVSWDNRQWKFPPVNTAIENCHLVGGFNHLEKF